MSVINQRETNLDSTSQFDITINDHSPLSHIISHPDVAYALQNHPDLFQVFHLFETCINYMLPLNILVENLSKNRLPEGSARILKTLGINCEQIRLSASSLNETITEMAKVVPLEVDGVSVEVIDKLQAIVEKYYRDLYILLEYIRTTSVINSLNKSVDTSNVSEVLSWGPGARPFIQPNDIVQIISITSALIALPQASLQQEIGKVRSVNNFVAISEITKLRRDVVTNSQEFFEKYVKGLYIELIVRMLREKELNENEISKVANVLRDAFPKLNNFFDSFMRVPWYSDKKDNGIENKYSSKIGLLIIALLILLGGGIYYYDGETEAIEADLEIITATLDNFGALTIAEAEGTAVANYEQFVREVRSVFEGAPNTEPSHSLPILRATATTAPTFTPAPITAVPPTTETNTESNELLPLTPIITESEFITVAQLPLIPADHSIEMYWTFALPRNVEFQLALQQLRDTLASQNLQIDLPAASDYVVKMEECSEQTPECTVGILRSVLPQFTP